MCSRLCTYCMLEYSLLRMKIPKSNCTMGLQLPVWKHAPLPLTNDQMAAVERTLCNWERETCIARADADGDRKSSKAWDESLTLVTPRFALDRSILVFREPSSGTSSDLASHIPNSSPHNTDDDIGFRARGRNSDAPATCAESP